VPPAETDSSNRIYRKYYEAYMDRVQEIWRLWDNIAHEKELAIRVRGQSWRRARYSKRSEASKPGGGMVQCGSPWPLRGKSDLGLCAAGPRCLFRYAGPHYNERLGRLQ
jgi:hypothetical protein